MATGQICVALEKPGDARDFFNRVLEIEPWNEAARPTFRRIGKTAFTSRFCECRIPGGDLPEVKP